MIALAPMLRAADVEAIRTIEPRPTHQITLRSHTPIRFRLCARRAAPRDDRHNSGLGRGIAVRRPSCARSISCPVGD